MAQIKSFDKIKMSLKWEKGVTTESLYVNKLVSQGQPTGTKFAENYELWKISSVDSINCVPPNQQFLSPLACSDSLSIKCRNFFYYLIGKQTNVFKKIGFSLFVHNLFLHLRHLKNVFKIFFLAELTIFLLSASLFYVVCLFLFNRAKK